MSQLTGTIQRYPDWNLLTSGRLTIEETSKMLTYNGVVRI